MAAQRYFCEQIRPGTCALSPEETRHASSVMRVRVGDSVELFDGQGTVAEATVTLVARESVSVEVGALRPHIPRPEPLLTLHVAVPKGSRQHVLIEKCTELGVSTIQPIIAARSVVKPGASAVSRWCRYAVEAGKQSGQAWLPDLHPPRAYRESLKGARGGGLNLIATPGAAATRLSEVLAPFLVGQSCSGLRDAGRTTGEDAVRHQPIATPGVDAGRYRNQGLPSKAAQATPRLLTHISVWIGPEGGFTPDETQAALDAGLRPVSLGDSVLRIETAAIATAAAVRLCRL